MLKVNPQSAHYMESKSFIAKSGSNPGLSSSNQMTLLYTARLTLVMVKLSNDVGLLDQAFNDPLLMSRFERADLLRLAAFNLQTCQAVRAQHFFADDPSFDQQLQQYEEGMQHIADHFSPT